MPKRDSSVTTTIQLLPCKTATFSLFFHFCDRQSSALSDVASGRRARLECHVSHSQQSTPTTYKLRLTLLSSMRNRTSSLLRLPGELRYKIHEHVLCGQTWSATGAWDYRPF
jgi:hypothetical protein